MIYRQVENSFTQPNAAMNIQMLEWALDVTKGATGDLLELYCGNGNFSLALARNFDRVLATEIAKPSVAAAQYNIAANHIDNVQIIRMAAEEFTQAMNGVRQFNRLQGIDLHSYQCETIFVDPPRSGLDSETEKNGAGLSAYFVHFVQPGNAVSQSGNAKPDAQRYPAGAVRPVPVYPSHGVRRPADPQIRPKKPATSYCRFFTTGGLLGCGIFAVTHLVADPEDHRDGQNGREEVRTDIRVLRTHDVLYNSTPRIKKRRPGPVAQRAYCDSDSADADSRPSAAGIKWGRRKTELSN